MNDITAEENISDEILNNKQRQYYFAFFALNLLLALEAIFIISGVVEKEEYKLMFETGALISYFSLLVFSFNLFSIKIGKLSGIMVFLLFTLGLVSVALTSTEVNSFLFASKEIKAHNIIMAEALGAIGIVILMMITYSIITLITIKSIEEEQYKKARTEIFSFFIFIFAIIFIIHY
jgi:hypothetical protein